MNELPIVILSRDLKYSLAQQKVKTLQKAIELLPKLGQNDENKKKLISKLANQYGQIKTEVQSQFNKMFGQNSTQNIKGQSTQQIIRPNLRTPSSPFYEFLLSKCICQIYGPKGSGKTCLLLNFAQQFAFANKPYIKNTRIAILNCVSGITTKRIQKLQKYKQQGMQIECLQIPIIEQVIKALTKINQQLGQGERKKIFIGIDMMVLLLMSKEKTKIYVTKIMEILAQIVQKYFGVVVFTNFVQHKFELGNQQIYNHASYYCQQTAENLTHKIYVERPDKTSAGRFKLTNLKGKKMEAFFQIGVNGVKQIQYAKQ